MVTIKLTNQQAEVLKKALTKRRDYLAEGYETETEYRQAMWPIVVEGDMLKRFKKRLANRQEIISTYNSVLNQLA